MTKIIRRGRIGEPKLVTARKNEWTPAVRERFLDHLAATCNVRDACLAAGKHSTGAYGLRRRDPEFAAQWQTALETGYAVLEAALLEHALAPLQDEVSGELEPADAATGAAVPTPGGGSGPFDPEYALRLLNNHRTMQGRGRHAPKVPGPRPARATPAETDAAIMAALARIDARQPGRGRTPR